MNIELTEMRKSEKRIYLCLNNGWKFDKYTKAGAESPKFNDSGWRVLDLPHDWAIEGFDIRKKKYDIPVVPVVRGKWKFKKGDREEWKDPYFDDSAWEEVKLPGYWEVHSNYTKDNAYGWFRREIEIPLKHKGKDIIINAGLIDDVDETFLNGVLIGKSGEFPPDYVSKWNKEREYRVDSSIVKYGENNTLAIRVFDKEGPGGIWAQYARDATDGPFSTIAEGFGSNGYLSGGIGWYRKEFRVSSGLESSVIKIEFDGVYMDSDVWINGQHLGNHPYGYTGFSYDLTPFIKTGDKENIVVVRVNAKQPCTRWYSGAGIYRDVRLCITAPVHVAQWGTYITVDDISETGARVNVETDILNESAANEEITLKTRILAPDGNKCGESELPGTVEAGKNSVIKQSMVIDNPRLWSIENPAMYKAVSSVIVKGVETDVYETSFGIRTIEFTQDNGFFLNGERIRIKGVCLHHDNGYLGAAFHKRAAERQLEIMKEMGCNAIRTSHNPPDPYLLELCDRMGMLVMDECFDEWKENKTLNGYGRFFEEWADRDLASMVLRDRNHPSIIMWSVGNEIAEQWAGRPGDAEARTKRLADLCGKLDPTRPVTAACNVVDEAVKKGMAKHLDVFGINYNPWAYKEQKGKRKIIASETASTVSSRGVYNLVIKDGEPAIEPKLNNHCTSYDTFAPEWSTVAAESIKAVETSPWVAGEFVWTGFDYIGEPTPFWWPSVISYFGITDLCGFPKDRYYLYRSRWTKTPMAHLLPHWNWGKEFEGKKIPVYVYTNCESAELFLNGKSLGEKEMRDFSDLRIEWFVEYEPGTLAVTAKNKGVKICEKQVVTAGEPAAISLSADRSEIRADGRDLSYITVKAVDDKGVFCPTAGNIIKFSVKGEGFIAATGNGDPTNHAFFTDKKCSLFNGMCLLIIKSKGGPGKIKVKAESGGIAPAEITIKAK